MLCAVAVFAVMDATMKELVRTYAPLQVAALRAIASLPFLFAVIAIANRWRELVPHRWMLHLTRGVLAIAMLWLFVYAVSVLPLGEAYAIFLCAPLLVTALSVLLLREHVSWRRWTAIAIGLLGVLVILRPSAAQIITIGGMASFASAVCYALGIVMIRTMAQTESTWSISVSFLMMVAVIASLAARPQWLPIRPEHWLLIGVLGVTGALGQVLIVDAFRRAPASVIAPFEYTALLWGIAIDLTVWNTPPSARMLLGGMIVIGSGLYLLHRERRADAAIH
jgi:drug/metabolite transporter (DMT)-like permease